MFLFERLFGVCLYSFILILVYFAISNTHSYKKIDCILFVYTVFLSLMGYFYVPYITADLYRINEMMVSLGSNSLSAVLSSGFSLTKVLYWAIGKTGVVQILPALNAFICYNCIFYIIRRTAKTNLISSRIIASALLFYMSIGNYMFVITGIRTMLGVSLLSFCFYREKIEKKFSFIHVVFYIIAFFIHAFSAVLIISRFLVEFLDSKMSQTKKIVYFVFLGIGGMFVLYYFRGYIKTIVEKALSYLSYNHYSYLWEYVIAGLSCLVYVWVFGFRKRIKNSYDNLSTWLLYSIIWFYVSLLFCFEFSIFHRLTTYIIPITVLPSLMASMKINSGVEDHPKYFSSRFSFSLRSKVNLVSFVILFITCSRGSLSSLKFFVL